MQHLKKEPGEMLAQPDAEPDELLQGRQTRAAEEKRL